MSFRLVVLLLCMLAVCTTAAKRVPFAAFSKKLAKKGFTPDDVAKALAFITTSNKLDAGFPIYQYLDHSKEILSGDEGPDENLPKYKKDKSKAMRFKGVGFGEPDDDVYYGSKPRTPVRLTNTNFEEFAEYIRKGEPVIVTDATKGWPLKGWSCDKFRAEFPKEKMRQEYLKGRASDTNYMKLENENWKDKKRPIDNGPEGPDFAPWYWDFKANKDLSKQTRKKMSSLTRAPYFLEKSAMNKLLVNRSGEFWLSRKEAGAKAHSDAHCESTMSVQLSGKKRWRLSPMPRIDSFATIKRHRDGDVDTATWKPKFDLVLNEGEGLFFPPGFIHETTNVGEGCAVSATYQFDDPAPSHYIREYMPRTSLDSHIGNCGFVRGTLVTFAANPRVTYTTKQSSKKAARLFKRVDSNKDGFLSLQEVKHHCVKTWNRRHLAEHLNMDRLPKGISKKVANNMKENIAHAAFLFHDKNKDGKISPMEMEQHFKLWNALLLYRHRGFKHIRSFHKTKKRCKPRYREEAVRLGVAMHALASMKDKEAQASLRKAIVEYGNTLPSRCSELSEAARDLVATTAINPDMPNYEAKKEKEEVKDKKKKKEEGKPKEEL